MGTIFSELLVKCRKNAGFHTAYAFFHENGGQEILKVSYRKYLKMERGELLPKFDKLATYIYTLRLFPRSHSSAEFLAAWLKTHLGEEAFEHLLLPFFQFPRECTISSPLHQTVKKSLAHNKFQISPVQMRAIVHSWDNYMIWTLLSNDTGWWDAKGIAREAGTRDTSATKALNNLFEAGLLKRKNSKYKCPFSGMMMEYPHPRSLPKQEGLPARLTALRNKMFTSKDTVFARRGVLRASLTELANLFPLLSLNLNMAQTYSVTEKQKDSALFGMEFRVTKLRNF